MSFLDKMKIIANKTVEVAKETAQSTKDTYHSGGFEALGNKAGQATKGLVDNVSLYADEVNKEIKKAQKPVGIAFNKEKPAAQVAAKVAMGFIASMRKVTLDATDKISEAGEKFNQLENKPKNKP